MSEPGAETEIVIDRSPATDTTSTTSIDIEQLPEGKRLITAIGYTLSGEGAKVTRTKTGGTKQFINVDAQDGTRIHLIAVRHINEDPQGPGSRTHPLNLVDAVFVDVKAGTSGRVTFYQDRDDLSASTTRTEMPAEDIKILMKGWEERGGIDCHALPLQRYNVRKLTPKELEEFAERIENATVNSEMTEKALKWLTKEFGVEDITDQAQRTLSIRSSLPELGKGAGE